MLKILIIVADDTGNSVIHWPNFKSSFIETLGDWVNDGDEFDVELIEPDIFNT